MGLQKHIMKVKHLFFGTLIFTGLAGCMVEPPKPKPLNGVIINHSGKTIDNIYIQDCQAANTDEWSTLLEGPLASGKQIEIQLVRPCMNLKAVDQEGKDIGKQWGIKNTYPFMWKIR